MLKSDLKEIKQIVDTSVKENNEKIFKRIEAKIDNSTDGLAINTNESFDELEEKMNERFDGVDNRLDKMNKKLEQKADRNTLLNWVDNRILGLESDRNKVKYLHVEEWKNLPSASKINSTLIKEGIK